MDFNAYYPDDSDDTIVFEDEELRPTQRAIDENAIMMAPRPRRRVQTLKARKPVSKKRVSTVSKKPSRKTYKYVKGPRKVVKVRRAGTRTLDVGGKNYYNIPTYSSYAMQQRRYSKRTGAPRQKAPGWISAGGSAAGAALGEAILPGPGAAIGGFLGGKLGHLIEQISGFGDYKVKNNTLMTGGMSPPQIVNSVTKGGYIVRHREYLFDVAATQAFTIQTLPLNPGMDSTFPWLSQVANSFEEYRFRGMIFEFKSLSSDAVLSSSTSSALGAVIMATQYNSVAPPFTDKKSMENYEFGNSSKPSCSFIHPIECKSSVTPVSILYTRNGAVPTGADQRLYDLGEFSIATQGMQATSGVAGELWVTYEVEFFKSKFNPVNQTDHFQLAGVTDAAPLGLTTPIASFTGSSIGGTISANGQTYSFPSNIGSGLFLFVLSYEGSTANVTDFSLGVTNVVLVNLWKNDTTPGISSPTPSANGRFVRCYTLRVLSQGAAITFSGAVLPGSPANSDLWVTRLSNTIVK